MIFQDNVIKEYLKNVYFITGTPCGGKTTTSRALGKKYNIPVYDIDERFPNHQRMSDPLFQPAMNKKFKNADEFFGRTVEEYREWLIKNTREQLEYVIMDLISLSQNSPIICDCHLTVEQADIITTPDKVAFMIKEPTALVEDYCNRPDHQGFSNYIHSTTDVEAAKRVCNETLKSLNDNKYAQIRESEYFWIDRKSQRTVDEAVDMVANHFGLK